MNKHKDSAASAPRTRARKIGFIKLGSLAKRVQHNGSLTLADSDSVLVARTGEDFVAEVL